MKATRAYGRTVAHTSGLAAGLLALMLPFAVHAEPRIAPLPVSAWSDEQRDVVESAPGPVTNAMSTYLHHPLLATDLLAFQHFIENESSLPARDRELVILRTAWLTRSDYVWAHHAGPARQAGLTDDELQQVAHGPRASGWEPFEAALLKAVDELHIDSFVSDDTWTTLEERYTPEQLVDFVFTVGEFHMVAGTVNSVGVEVEPQLADRRPYGVPYRVSAEWTNERLIGKGPRIEPLEREDWSPGIRELLDPEDSGRRLANVYKTYVNSLQMDLLRRPVSEHIRNDTTLTDWQREVLLLRIGVLCRSEYEWAAHSRIARRVGMEDRDIARIVAGPDHPNEDPIEWALLRAADELYRDDVVSDETWAMLDEQFTTEQLLDVLTAIGGYRMFSMAISTFGVQLDPNMMDARFPPHLR